MHPIASTFDALLRAFDGFVAVIEHTFVLDVGAEGARVFGVESDGGMGTLLPLSHLPCSSHHKMALLEQAPAVAALGRAWHEACQKEPALVGILGTGRLYAAQGHQGALFCWNPIVDTAEAINEGAWGHPSNLGAFVACVAEACRRLPPPDAPLADLAAFSPIEAHLHLTARSTPEVVHALLPLLFAPYDPDRPACIGSGPEGVEAGESLDLPSFDVDAARRFSEGLWDISWLLAAGRPAALSSMHLQGGQNEDNVQFGHINDDLMSVIDDAFVPQPPFQATEHAWMERVRSLWMATLQAMPDGLFGMQHPVYAHWHEGTPSRPMKALADLPPRAFPLHIRDLPIALRFYGVDGHRQITDDVLPWMFPSVGPEHVVLSDGKKLGIRVRAADGRTAAALIRRSFVPDAAHPITAWRVVDQDALPPLPMAANDADSLDSPV